MSVDTNFENQANILDGDLSADLVSTISTNVDENKGQIKMLVKEWINLTHTIKAQNKRKKEVAAILAPIMKQNNVDECNLKEEGVGVKCRTQTTRAGISKKSLNQTLTQYFDNNPDTALEATEFIWNARQTKPMKHILFEK